VGSRAVGQQIRRITQPEPRPQQKSTYQRRGAQRPLTIKLSCYEPDAARRAKEAMSLIEHEWNYSAGKSGRRIFVEILDNVIRTVR
jgi:hypothetical protein